MAKNIAVAGKGGTGKTTFASLVIRYLIEKTNDSILAVDADPNSNLNEALGVDIDITISQVLEDTKNPKAIPEGMSKNMYIQYKLAQALIETDRVDLLAMGGPQGPGCYCYPNDILKKHLKDLSENYDYIVADNEAGLEHISRQTIPQVDHLFIISDGSARGIRSAGRVHELVKDLKKPIKNIYLVITKTDEKSLEILQDEISKTGLQLTGWVPMDPKVTEFDVAGKPLISLPEESPALKAIYSILDSIKL
jgi:CO dehydrogenase maturation factor